MGTFGQLSPFSVLMNMMMVWAGNGESGQKKTFPALLSHKRRISVIPAQAGIQNAG
jgi:hypothetical protein